MWNIQEFVLAKHSPIVYVGRHVAEWSDFCATVRRRCLDITQAVLRPPIGSATPDRNVVIYNRIERCRSNIWQLTKWRSDEIGDSSLTSPLACSTFFEATDERDKVYGLLEICTFEVTKPILPDYSKTLRQVFAEATVISIVEQTARQYTLKPFYSESYRPNKGDPMPP